MSRETQKWLDNNTLIGFTESRGNAWHWRAGTDNHFSGAVPVKRVRDLLGWEPVTIPVTYPWKGRTRDTDRILVVHGTTGDVLGSFKNGYQPHSYGEWLVEKVETLLDSSVQIGSAGQIKNGAIAWVSVEVPDAIDIPRVGEKIRPSLTAMTSFDGTVATTYKRLFTRIVCDNTFEMGRSEKTNAQVKVKHTRTSAGRLNVLTSRDALQIVFDSADEFAREIESLATTKVTTRQWNQFLDIHVPMVDEKKNPLAGRGRTMAVNKVDALKGLYANDMRVAPWAGTAWGVLNAVNTYNQHMSIVRNGERAERSMENAVKGKTKESDDAVLAQLELVLAK
jgi:phage/plasmid-like protein (TIGR03299 family)